MSARSPLDHTPLNHTLPPSDVILHLRSAQPRLVSLAEKERLLATGVSYGELLTPEQPPADWQQQAYAAALARTGAQLGQWLAQLLAQILTQPKPVLVSLARAGIPMGCVLRRLARHWGLDLPHHALSIIRGVGIDQVALATIQQKHPSSQLIFVDGWTGKGSIFDTLQKSLPTDVEPLLAVVSDPAQVAHYAATHQDVLLPHALLNATICGLLSRTFYTQTDSLHAARLEQDLRPYDVSLAYVQALTDFALAYASEKLSYSPPLASTSQPTKQVLQLAAELGTHDPHLVKPSVGEATRVFLRRQPAALLLQNTEHPDTLHLHQLAQAKEIPIIVQTDLPYLAVALIASAGSA